MFPPRVGNPLSPTATSPHTTSHFCFTLRQDLQVLPHDPVAHSQRSLLSPWYSAQIHTEWHRFCRIPWNLLIPGYHFFWCIVTSPFRTDPHGMMRNLDPFCTDLWNLLELFHAKYSLHRRGLITFSHMSQNFTPTEIRTPVFWHNYLIHQHSRPLHYKVIYVHDT